MTATPATSAASVPLFSRLGYGVGDLAFNLYFTTANLFLLLYYTDVLGLSPTVGGLVFAIALIWDAVLDPVMGYVASRTRSRWGRYRPYLLFGAVPLAISWALIFLPLGLKGTALVVCALAAHILFRTLYTVVSMPYLSLSAAMTRSSSERGTLAGIRMLAATGGGLLVAFFTLKAVGWLGQGDQALGFFRVAIGFGVVATLIFWLTFATTREVIGDVAEPLPSAAGMRRMIVANRAFWLLSGWLLALTIGSTFFGKSVPYFFKYAVAREDLIGPALAILTAAAMISIPIWAWIMRRTSKRAVSLAGSSLSLIGYAAFWCIPTDRIALLLIALAWLGFAAGAIYLTFWAMVPDTVEYGEWRSRVRAEGAVFGLVTLVQKAALGVGVGLVGTGLGVIGYVANQAQTAQTIVSMRSMMVLLPCLFAAAGIAAIWFYPIDQRLHARLVRAISHRQRRATLV